MTKKDRRKKEVVAAMNGVMSFAEDTMVEIEQMFNNPKIQVSSRCRELLDEIKSVCWDVSSQVDENRQDDPEGFDGEAFYDLEDD